MNIQNKLWYNSILSINLASIELDTQPPRTAEFKAERIQLYLLISFTFGLTCLHKMFDAFLVFSGTCFNYENPAGAREGLCSEVQ